MQNDIYLNYLRHHGILGQKWGKRNGPPYPLGASGHSASEEKAGWRKSLDKPNVSKHTKDSVLKEPEIFEQYIAKGKTIVNSVLKQNMAGATDDTIHIGKQAADSILEQSRKTAQTIGEFKKLERPETLEETLSKANPLKGTCEGKNNCVPSAIAGFMRQKGYDVTAKSTGGKMQNTAGVVEECFRGAKVLEGSAVKFGRSRQDAEEMLLKQYGQNAEGLCSIDWKSGGGHCFSWKIEDDIVTFFDNNAHRDDELINKFKYFDRIDPNGQLVLARLDGLEINEEAVKKYVE